MFFSKFNFFLKKTSVWPTCISVDDEIRYIPVEDLIEPWIIQRPVDKLSVEYLELRDSIKQWGVIVPLTVRVARSPGKFETIVGNHRRTVCRELGIQLVPCLVKQVADEDIRAFQIQEHAIRREPTFLEYCRQLKKIMCPGMTQSEASRLIHKTPKWVRQVLGMENLTEESLKAVERGDVSLEDGYELSKIPVEQQAEFLERALTMRKGDFKKHVQAYVKQLKEAAISGRLRSFWEAKFKPQAHLRHPNTLKAELKKGEAGCLRAQGLTPSEAWYGAIKWMLHLDDESVQEQVKRYEERMKSKILQREIEPCDT